MSKSDGRGACKFLRVAKTRRPKALARRATISPVAPKPTMPSAQVESRCNWVDSARAWRKRPARMNCSILGSWRARDSSMAMMWSVISSAQKKGALETTMPCSVAFSTAILSVPLPRREIRRQRSSDATTAAGKPVETTATASQPANRRMSSCGSSSSTYSGSMPNLAYSDCLQLVGWVHGGVEADEAERRCHDSEPITRPLPSCPAPSTSARRRRFLPRRFPGWSLLRNRGSVTGG